MVGLRSPSIGLGLALVALACFFGSALAAPQVYLSLNGATAWDGACPASGSSCSAATPCALPAHGITLDASVFKCEISIGPGAYGTENEKQKVSIIQAPIGNANLTVSFDGSDGGVVGLDITLSAMEVGYNGLISQSSLNVILGPVKTVRLNRLKSNSSRVFFTGTQPFAYSPSITVTGSEMRFTQLLTTNLFTFDVTDSAKPKTISSFQVESSVIGLNSDLVGLVSVSSGLRIETVSVISSTIAETRAIITYDKPMPTKVTMRASHVTVGANVIKSTAPIDPLTFNRTTSGMIVNVVSGTLRGAHGSLANLYDDNACADLTTSESNIQNLVFGCSGAYTSTKDTDRCRYDWMSTNFTDNRICLSNRVGSDEFQLMNVKFLVSVPTLAPVMTHFENVSFDVLLLSASFETVARETTSSAVVRVYQAPLDDPVPLIPVVDPIPGPIDSPTAVVVPIEAPIGAAPVAAPVEAPIAAPVEAPVAAPIAAPVAAPIAAPVASPVAAAPVASGIAFLFSGRISFDDSSSVIFSASSLVLSPLATISVATIDIKGFVTFGDGSKITGPRFLTFYAPLTFSGPGSICSSFGVSIVPDVPSTVPGVPIISFVNGAIFRVAESPLYFLATHLYIKWPKTSAAPLPETYTVFNSVVADYPWGTRRYSAQETNYQFTAWASSTPACGETCGTVMFALSSVVAPGDAPSAPPSTSPSTTPITRVPVTITPNSPPPTTKAPSTGGTCTGFVPSNFACVQGVWTYNGNWIINSKAELDGTNTVSPIYVNGNVTIQSGGSLYFRGNLATLRVSGCVTAPINSIFLDYTKGWPSGTESWTQEVIRISSDCPVKGYNLPFNILKHNGCRTFTAQPQSFLNSLTISWTTSSSKCKLPLIIGIIVGTVVLAGVGGLIAFLVVRHRRASAAKRNGNGGFSSDYEPLMSDH